MPTGKMRVVDVTCIRSTAQKVFEAMARPDVAGRCWGHENNSDWKAGSDWQHVRADDPAAYSRVCFDIAPYEDMVRLTVTHDELEAGGSIAKGIQQGWPIVLSSLKSLLETGEGIDVFAKPKGGGRVLLLEAFNPSR